MKSDTERLAECLVCEYYLFCAQMVAEPEEYSDGTCKTKDGFREVVMYCIYNTGGFCYEDSEDVKECPYAGEESDCENAEEG